MSQNLTKVGIVGASGYTGEELVRVLARHPRVALAAVCSRTLAGKAVADELARIDAQRKLDEQTGGEETRGLN
ncbi:MAG: hypothetical protein EBR70_04200 [Verrucomicrobia bacterium]|nr:hypothetical protein [Verrucomicrobiota bacterium]